MSHLYHSSQRLLGVHLRPLLSRHQTRSVVVVGGGPNKSPMDPRLEQQEADLKPVITIPVEVQKRALKRQEKLKRESVRKSVLGINDGDRSRCLIRCRRSELDHFAGQTYNRYEKIPLASEHWQSKRTIGDFFSFPVFKSPSYKIKQGNSKFSTLEDLDPRLVAALNANGFVKMTYVQDQAIPAVLSGRNMIIASETGNGKTLAYLIPLVQKMLENFDAERAMNSPRAVVVAPSRELALQIKDVAEAVCDPLGLKVGLAQGGAIDMKLQRNDKQNLDLLVGSFGGLRKLFMGGLYHREALRHVVYDECDSLLDDTFNSQSVPFISYLASKSLADVQLLLVGATFPTNLDGIMRSVIQDDELEQVTTNELHMVPPHINQTFLRVPKAGKEFYLLDVIEKDVDKGRPLVIFSNKSSTSQFLTHFLKDHKIRSVALNGHTDVPERRENLRRFLSGEVNVLTCTDLASRGLDTSNAVHVVNYEFPLNMFDYLHRLGRVGRVRSPGGSKATHLVVGPRQVKLVQDIELAVRTRKKLPNVNHNIIRIIEHGAEMREQRRQMALARRRKEAVDDDSEMDT